MRPAVRSITGDSGRCPSLRGSLDDRLSIRRRLLRPRIASVGALRRSVDRLLPAPDPSSATACVTAEGHRSVGMGLAILACAAALLVPRDVAPWLIAVSALLLIASAAQGLSAPGRSIRLGLLAFLFSSGWTIHYQPGAPVDLFEDGQPLANAATYLQGGHPYLQTYPVHGWGADGGLDSLFFRVFGPSLQTFRVRRAIVTALALTALGLCS